jgi:hypothetical protein
VTHLKGERAQLCTLVHVRFCDHHNSIVFREIQTEIWKHMLDCLIETFSIIQMLGDETIQRSPYLKTFYESLKAADRVFTENLIPNYSCSEIVPINHRHVFFSTALFTRCLGNSMFEVY